MYKWTSQETIILFFETETDYKLMEYLFFKMSVTAWTDNTTKSIIILLKDYQDEYLKLVLNYDTKQLQEFKRKYKNLSIDILYYKKYQKYTIAEIANYTYHIKEK